MNWLRRFRRPCSIHDRPYPMKIARLEEQTGIQPGAVAALFAAGPDLVDTYSNPDLIDCGRNDCRRRRMEQR